MTIRRLLPYAFWAALLFAFVMAVLPKPPQLPGQPSDKIQHILAFTVLAGLAAAAYPRTSLVRILLLLSAFGALIEFVQTIPALHRDGDWVDWVADTLAAAFVLGLAALVRKRFFRA
jgi:VanZ family protein